MLAKLLATEVPSSPPPPPWPQHQHFNIITPKTTTCIQCAQSTHFSFAENYSQIIWLVVFWCWTRTSIMSKMSTCVCLRVCVSSMLGMSVFSTEYFNSSSSTTVIHYALNCMWSCKDSKQNGTKLLIIKTELIQSVYHRTSKRASQREGERDEHTEFTMVVMLPLRHPEWHIFFAWSVSLCVFVCLRPDQIACWTSEDIKSFGPSIQISTVAYIMY